MDELDNIITVLRDRFGFDGFRQGQEEVIRCLMSGRSAGAIFPTGAGKSLCYQLPALLLPGMTLVISPLLALMKDQIDALRARGIEAERLDSSLEEEDYRRVTEAVRAGRVKLLFVAPERLSNERFINLLGGQRISLLAVDEAHCISAWGHNFRPDYLKLAQAAKDLRVERVLALTATATPKVVDDMARAFAIESTAMTNTGFYRANLELHVSACTDRERVELLLRRLGEREPGPTIVYVSLQRHAEEVAGHLQAAGLDAAAYHSGMAAADRSRVQDDFMHGRRQIICATIAFGMGIDKEDIRYVYHYHMPKGYESYMQEIGRAGRDGKAAVCELFACADDATILENFVYGDTPDDESLLGLLTELLTGADGEIDLAVSDLSRRFDMRPLVLNTLLTRLELAGIIKSEGHYYGSIRFAPKLSGKQILQNYPASQAKFLREVFTCCSKAKKWVTVDVEQVKTKTGQNRDVLLRALESLQEKGLAELQLAGYRQRFRRLVDEPDIRRLTEKMAASFLKHEALEIERIERMMGYAESSGCLTAELLAYFGEEMKECGHCSICLGQSPQKLSSRNRAKIPDRVADEFESVVAANQRALGRPRQQARFLCGLSSPGVSAVRGLRGNPLFGCCASVPFSEVLASRAR